MSIRLTLVAALAAAPLGLAACTAENRQETGETASAPAASTNRAVDDARDDVNVNVDLPDVNVEDRDRDRDRDGTETRIRADEDGLEVETRQR